MSGARAPVRRGLLERIAARRPVAWDPQARPPPRPLAPGLLSIDRRVRLPGGVGLPTRAVAVDLPGGGVAVASPPPLDAGLEGALAERGGVRAILAPGSFHYLALPEWAKAFPDAEVWLAPGLATRRPDLPRGRVLGGSAPEDASAVFGDVLETAVYGPVRGVSEVALLHRPTRSLLVTDALFHLPPPRGPAERIAWWLLDAGRGPAPGRTARLVLLTDPERVRAFAEALIAWEPRRLVPAHGDPVEGDVGAVLRRAFADFAPAPPSLP